MSFFPCKSPKILTFQVSLVLYWKCMWYHLQKCSDRNIDHRCRRLSHSHFWIFCFCACTVINRGRKWETGLTSMIWTWQTLANPMIIASSEVLIRSSRDIVIHKFVFQSHSLVLNLSLALLPIQWVVSEGCLCILMHSVFNKIAGDVIFSLYRRAVSLCFKHRWT